MEGQFESWITLATNDAKAWTALVLAKSLRRTTTGRKLSLIITNQVSSELKYILAQEFDFIEKVDENDLKLWHCPSQLLKLWSWNLKGWNKCVFVDPSIIVLRNCDELFDHAELSAVPKSTENATEFDSSLFVFQPKGATFGELLKTAHQNGGTNANEIDVLQAYFKKWANKANLHLDAELYSLTKSNRNQSAVKLAKFDQEQWKNLDGHEDSLEKLWLKIYTQDVLLPILKEEKPALKSWLLKSLASIGLPVQIPAPLINERIHSAPPQELMDSVAVIGMSCRFPGSNSAAEYWDFLCSGQDGITHYPTDRPRSRTYITDEYYDLVKAGFLKCSIDEFDCKFFGLSPREAELMDPQQRILLEVAWESFEAAGINPHSLKGNSKTGVYVGIWQQEYDRMFVPVLYPMHYKQLGNSYGATASRISYFLGLLGPNIAVESGCSSSLAALHLACESLRRGESNLGVAAGVNIFQIMPTPAENKTLAPDFHCKTFDEGANGFGRGEGCGVLILKRFADAWADGDNILAAIRGSAVNNDGTSNSFGTPFAPGQMSAAKAALARAKVHPLEVSYVECHGTGTAVGDPIEFHGLSQVYGVGPRPRPMFLSSVKTNIGHAESAAGIAGVIKVILAMQAKALPPHLNLKKVNPKINLNLIPAHIPTEVTEWISPERALRIAAVSAFSLSGNNAHMILQEVPKREAIDAHSRMRNEYATQIITLSAKTEEALSALREKYIQFGRTNPSVNLADLAFTANCGRAHFPHRSTITVAGSTAAELAAKLESGSFDSGIVDAKGEKQPRIGFLFTGQGSQYAGMAWDLYKSSAVFRSAFYECDKLFKARIGLGLEETWKSPELLSQTLYSQPSIFCLQVCLIKLWASLGVKPTVVLGHSVGEFAAVVAAGILSLESAMDLILSRSLLIHKLVAPGAMLAVKQSHAKVNGIIAKVINNNSTAAWIDVAAINSPEETVVSGTPEAIKLFEKACEAEGVKTTVLSAAAHAFHSRAMDAILKDYGEIAGNLKYLEKTHVRYVSGLKAAVVKANEFSPAYWQHHVRDPVQFFESIQIVCKEVDILIEIGPHPVLLPLAMNSPGSTGQIVYCPTLRRTEENSATISASLSKLYLAGVEIGWKAWHGEGTQKVPNLPLYPFQREGQKFWFREGEELDRANSKFGGKSLHPILGSKIPSPHSATTTTFHNTLQLTKLGYVEDHAVGGRVIFPAAGYLETILAAGVHSILGTASATTASQLPALCVSNFNIQSALELSKPTEIQTILTKENESTKINIFRQIGAQASDKWKSHAEASFQILPKPTHGVLNVNELKSRLTLQKEGLYTRLAEIGYNFGTKFQSIAKVWSSNAHAECLTSVEIDLSADGVNDYFCHPVIIDAMLQTAAVQSFLTSEAKGLKPELMLPVGVSKYIWLGKIPQASTTTRVFCHSRSASVTLYTESGETLAVMEGLEFLPTSLAAFLKNLRETDAEEIVIPSLYEFTWRPALGANRSRHALSPSTMTLATANSSLTAKAIAEVGFLDKTFESHIERLSFLYICKSIQEAGWEWTVGKPLTAATWKAKLPTGMKLFKLVEAYLEIFKKETSLFSNMTPKAALPAIPAIESEIKQITEIISSKFPEEDATLKFVTKCGENLTQVLLGEKTGLSVLFPQESSEFSVQEFYARSKFMQPNLKIIRSIFSDTTSPLLQQAAAKSRGVIRILEVGAGTGAATTEVVAALTQSGLPFEYTFTDISVYFLDEGKKRFGTSAKFDYRLLNLEEDPMSQGFAPNTFDIVIGCNVVHATKDLSQSLQHIRMLLREGGSLIMGELFKNYTYLVLSFGLVDGWWRFSDEKVRTTSPLVDPATWEMLLMKSRFNNIRSVEISNGGTGCMVATSAATKIPWKTLANAKTWVTFAFEDENLILGSNIHEKFKTYGRENILVKFNNSLIKIEENSTGFSLNPTIPAQFGELFDKLKNVRGIEGILFLATQNSNSTAIANEQIQRQACGGLLHLCQSVLSKYEAETTKPKIIAVTRGVQHIGADPLKGSPTMATLWGLLKVFANENPSYNTRLIDMDQSVVPAELEIEIEELFAQLWGNFTSEHFMAIREGKLFVQRATDAISPSTPLEYPKTPRFEFLNNGDGVLTDLQLVPAAGKEKLEATEVEVAVKATSLNFRDLLCILKPDGFTLGDGPMPNVGLDFSGVVTSLGSGVTRFKVGDAVYGYTDNGALSSHAIAPEIYLVHKPPTMTFSSAAAIPGVFLTSYVSFVTISKLSAKDRVLIHVAAGGVGLAAVQVAKLIGAEIFATAGSARKRNYLRGLGIKHVYNSRDTSYGAEIHRDTQGQGVTVVLNSLTSGNFKETTLQACARGARWVEIAKINIWSEAEVKKLRPDVEYVIFDLATMARVSPAEVGPLLLQLSKHFEKGEYAELPSTVFAFEQLKEALVYFQEAKHIGKIVISMPELSPDGGLQAQYFNKESTYVITGGLGGIGIEMVGWMLKKGAKHIVLVGRNAPSAHAQAEINRLNKTAQGGGIVVINADVSSRVECARLLSEIKALKTFPPVRGIMHAAGCLSDGVIGSQSWDKFSTTFNSKVYSAWHLHELTLNYDLEFFVLFSSMSTILGTHAQANHSAANAYLDSLAAYRHSLGLPATTINWGAWAEIGAAAGLIDKYMHEIIPFSPAQGIGALESIVRNKQRQVMVGDVKSWEMIREFYNLGSFMSELKEKVGNEKNAGGKGGAAAEPQLNLAVEMQNSTRSEVGAKIAQHVGKSLRLILRIPAHETLDEDASFFDLGMDSLMFMEFRNILQKMLGGAGKVLTLAALQENKSVRLVTEYIVELLYSEAEANAGAAEESLKNFALVDTIKKLKQMQN